MNDKLANVLHQTRRHFLRQSSLSLGIGRSAIWLAKQRALLRLLRKMPTIRSPPRLRRCRRR